MPNGKLQHGTESSYHWFQTNENHYTIGRLYKQFKEYLIGKYICIINSSDSDFIITNELAAKGFSKRFFNLDLDFPNTVALSPAVSADLSVPTSRDDEWYIFSSLPDNFDALPQNLRLSEFVYHRKFDFSKPSTLTKRFWEIMQANQVFAYVSERHDLKIVTQDVALTEALLRSWG